MLILASYCKERRYREDAINVVGLAEGTKIRWRYSRKHVEETLLQKERIKNKKLILAFISSNDDSISLMPVRHGNLLRIEEHGSIVEFVIKLGGYPDESIVDAATRSKTPDWYDSSLSTVISGNLAFSCNKIFPIKKQKKRTDSVTLWEHVVDRIFAQNVFQKEVDFLYCMKKEKPCFFFWRSFAYDGGFFFESNTKVKFRIHYKLSPRPRERNMKPIGEIVLNVSGAALDFITSRRVRIDAPRDSKLIELQVGSGYKVNRGHLAVSTRGFLYSKKSCEREEEAFTRHDIPVSTGILSPLLASIASALAIGLAAVGVPGAGEEIKMVGLILFTVLGAVGLSHGFK